MDSAINFDAKPLRMAAGVPRDGFQQPCQTFGFCATDSSGMASNLFNGGGPLPVHNSAVSPHFYMADVGEKLGDRLRCPKPPSSRIIHIISTARGQRCLSLVFSGY